MRTAIFLVLSGMALVSGCVFDPIDIDTIGGNECMTIDEDGGRVYSADPGCVDPDAEIAPAEVD